MAALIAGIEPGEVMQVLAAEHRLPMPAVSAHGVRVVAIVARTRTGRPLMVIVRLDPYGTDHLIVGARDLTSEELAAFERWEGERR